MDAPVDQFPPGRYPVVGQAVPSGKVHAPDLRREKRQGLGLAGHADVLARDHQHIPAFLGQGGDEQGIESLRRAADQGADNFPALAFNGIGQSVQGFRTVKDIC